MQKKLLIRLMSGAVVAAVTAGSALLVVNGVAGADVPPGTLGFLTTTPATGDINTAPVSRTSAPCPNDPNDKRADQQLIGPVGPDGMTAPDTATFPSSNPFPVTRISIGNFSTTTPFNLVFNNTFRDAATARGKTVQPGEYHLTARCLSQFGETVFGTFTGGLIFDESLNYTVIPPPSPSPSPTPTPVVTATPTPTPVVTATPTPTPVVTATPTPTPVVTATPTPTPVVTATPTPTPVVTATPTPTPVVTATPTPTPVVTATPTPTPVVTATPTPTPVVTATPTPTPVVTATPTPTPVVTATPTPTPRVTATPTPTPRVTPTPVVRPTKTELDVVRIDRGLNLALSFVNVAPPNATGTVVLKDGNTIIGGPQAVNNGFAFFINRLPDGQHSLTAVFTPTPGTAFGPSTSNTVKFKF